MKSFFRICLVIGLLAALLAGWLWYQASHFLNTPPAAHGTDVYVDIAQGANLNQVARELYEKGLVTDAKKFVWLARYKNQDKNIQAGRFLLNTGWTPGYILEALANGMPALYRITIPEGLTWWQTGRALADAGFVRYADFRELIANPDFLRHHGIPFANAEGFLMPDTYLMPKPDAPPLPKNATPEQIAADKALWQRQTKAVVSRMIDNFWRKATPVWAPDAQTTIVRPAPEDLKKWVILASIVEKETGVPGERARVAGVYSNRLARNMLLQADPTVSYGIGPAFTGRLRKIHLEDASNPYNTYQRPGLPPGPIASFGISCLKAAIKPEKHNYLFFVATGEGDTHTFTRNFEDHSAAVQEYRKKLGR